jgi:phage-related protein (TIGR01555 family)
MTKKPVGFYKQAKTTNTMLAGLGGNSRQDRGASQTATIYSTNPYFRNDFYSRYQEFVSWYYTSWEVQKIINIPVDDAFRKPFIFKGLNDEQLKTFELAWKKHGMYDKLKRLCIQERLLGGAIGIMGLKDEEDEPSNLLEYESVMEGDFVFLNVTSIDKISRVDYQSDPMKPDYDRPEYYWIQGRKVSVTRLLVFDGDPLFDRNSMNILQRFRYNPAGFGESVLTKLYDILIRETGSQQAAYHLINLASVLLVKADNMQMLQASNTRAYKAMEDLVEQISIYRGAVLQGKGVDVAQYNASFGSVPELLMTFLQILSAASDIPATRLLGQAPGGLNANGDSDLENYYNMVGAYQTDKIKPRCTKLCSVFGRHVFGSSWKAIEKDFDIEFEPLWNMSKQDQANVDNTYAGMYSNLVATGVISPEKAIEEMKTRKIFVTEIDESDVPELILDGGKASSPAVFETELATAEIKAHASVERKSQEQGTTADAETSEVEQDARIASQVFDK